MRRFEGGGPYLEFVMAGLGMSRDMLSEVKAGLFLGSEGFVEEMKTRVRGQVEPNVSQRAELLRKTPVSAGIASSQRDLQVYAMHRWFGKKQREIGELFGLTQSAVSQTLRRLESKLPQNPNLQAELDALRKRLS